MMGGPCFFLPGLKGAQKGDRVKVDGKEGHHIIHVLRRQRGALLELRDGHGWWAKGVLVDVSNKGIYMELIDVGVEEDDRMALWVLLSILKRDAMEWTLSRLCEIGVRTIMPVLSARSIARPRRVEKWLDRWRGLARSALKQSRGLYLTEIFAPLELSGAVELMPPSYKRFLLDEDGERPLSGAWRRRCVGGVVLAVGPEGGWTSEEREYLFGHHFEPVSLGTRILRSGTAAVAASFACGLLLNRG